MHVILPTDDDGLRGGADIISMEASQSPAVGLTSTQMMVQDMLGSLFFQDKIDHWEPIAVLDDVDLLQPPKKASLDNRVAFIRRQRSILRSHLRRLEVMHSIITSPNITPDEHAQSWLARIIVNITSTVAAYDGACMHAHGTRASTFSIDSVLTIQRSSITRCHTQTLTCAVKHGASLRSWTCRKVRTVIIIIIIFLGGYKITTFTLQMD